MLLVLLSTRFPSLCRRPSFFRLNRVPHLRSTWLPSALGVQHPFPNSCSHPRHGLPPSAAKQMHTQAGLRVDCSESSVTPAGHKASFHPWREWSKLVEHLTAAGYAERQVPPPQGEEDDSFSVSADLPEDFTRVAGACLLYARERPDLLRSLSKKDIELVVENGSPFLFRNGLNTVRRMKSFLGSDGSEALESEQACTVDLMRYLLSFACHSLASTGDETRCRELVESSVRSLLCELVKNSGDIPESVVTSSAAWHNPSGFEQSAKPPRQNIEMKKGDWICPKCSFMNFARNLKCLECDEARPKRQGGEWECPQCEFFNYGRNMTCLRCDCKRPAEMSSSRKQGIEQPLNSGNIDQAEVERRLAENDEKAERWFSKVSQLDDSSDLSSAIADEDFPEIMPLRKGINRFVISTRKTPLERRLANAQYRRNLGNEGSYMGKDSLGRMGSDKMTESAISQTLDRLLGRSSATSGTSKDAGHQLVSGELSTSVNGFSSLESRDSGSVPISSSSVDMLRTSPGTEVQKPSDKMDFTTVKSDQQAHTITGGFRSRKANKLPHSGDFNNFTGLGNAHNQAVSKTIKDSSDPTEGWSKRYAQIPDVASVHGASSGNGFPKTLPLHEEQNQFGINNNREHSLTSPHYKRRIAMDQANNFIPFVPFPPDYFAKKDKEPEVGSSAEKSTTESSASIAVGNDKGISQRFEGNKIEYSFEGGVSNIGQTGNPRTSGDSWNSGLPRTSLDERMVAPQTNSFRNNNPGNHGGPSSQEVTADGVSVSGNLNQQQVESTQKATENWNHSFPGKSLEGSAVTEPDPLDMSEEAKAQRWFRRVAQIKDISELSKIPDEDFPEIMPMRKGVNRFVVSKRKTPLERRLTSPQYRRNLPIVSSEPGKDPTRE